MADIKQTVIIKILDDTSMEVAMQCLVNAISEITSDAPSYGICGWVDYDGGAIHFDHQPNGNTHIFKVWKQLK